MSDPNKDGGPPKDPAAPPAVDNPFPGPRPYRRASDRARFFGRETLSYKLECAILANRCVAVYGPPGAGKTSLLRASVLPTLAESDDIRRVIVEAWPEGRDPTEWLAYWMFTDLRQGPVPAELSAAEAVISSAKRAARSSPRLLVVCLDHLESLLPAGSDPGPADALFDAVLGLVETPLRPIRVVLSFREDYLGRLSDRLKDRRRLLADAFRVGPLTVGELAQAMCKTAALGSPPIVWSQEDLGRLLLPVRDPGQAPTLDAEAQSAYGQIVCRSLFERFADGDPVALETASADGILRRYLEDVLDSMGPSRSAALALLGEHLVTERGERTLRTEAEIAERIRGEDLAPVLRSLERAAIVQSREQQGIRYYQLGHDWLSRAVHELQIARKAMSPTELPEEEALLRLAESRGDEALAEAVAKLRDERLALVRALRKQRALTAAVGALSLLFLVSVISAFEAHRARRAAESKCSEKENE